MDSREFLDSYTAYYPDIDVPSIDVKVEEHISDVTDEENMAVEALQQLGDAQAPKSTHNCPVCAISFHKKRELTAHLHCHAVPQQHSCKICGSCFIEKHDLVQHMASHKHVGHNECSFCGQVFTRNSALTNHIKIHKYQPGRAMSEHKVKNEAVAQIQLSKDTSDTIVKTSTQEPIHNICAYGNNTTGWKIKYESLDTVVSLEDITPHMVQSFEVHPNDIVVIVSEDDGMMEPKQPENDIVGYIVSEDESVLEPELPTTSKSKHLIASQNKVCKHECEFCDKKFMTKQKMLRHMWVHREKPHLCEVCRTSFAQQRELDKHRLKSHKPQSPYNCQECGKNFTSRQGLWEHTRVHSKNDNFFHCQLCDKNFSSRQGFLIHKRKHTDERPYGCRHCMKAFRDGGTLRKHERTHTGERPHACPVCTKKFNQKVVLREHLRWMHANNAAVDDEGCAICAVCAKSFADVNELCVHLVMHSDDLAAKLKATIPKASSPEDPSRVSCEYQYE